MLSEWNAACTHDDPTVVVPWSDPDSGVQFLDLRAEPYDIAEVAEAELHPALGRALAVLERNSVARNDGQVRCLDHDGPR